MEAPAPHFDRFLRALHRRLVFVRALERTGIGALTGCAAAAVLIPLLLWRGESALTPALFLLALGACIGLLWGITHRPTALAAAMEADRQLALADLLGTAVSCVAASDDPWCRSVLAVADDRCRNYATSHVLLHRFGGRAWGGIGLAAALVLTLSAMTGNPREVHAVVVSRGDISPSNSARAALAEQGARGTSTQRGKASPRDADPESQSPDASDPGAQRTASNDGGRNSVAEDRGRSSAADDNGKGSGAGRARDQVTSSDRSRNADGVPPAARSDRRGQPSAGSGDASAQPPSPATAPAVSDNASRTSSPSATQSPRTPPWHGASWPADARAAQDALEAGTVPDALRDLVRDYFERP